MTDQNTIALLNRLAICHTRSLATYLRFASPWFRNANQDCIATLHQMVASQIEMADRIGELILKLKGEVVPGEFPIRYTALNDLSIDYLMPRIIESHTHDIEVIQECVAGLKEPEARALAEEALGEAKAHLDALQESLQKSTA